MRYVGVVGRKCYVGVDGWMRKERVFEWMR